jgi:hypothetical protein
MKIRIIEKLIRIIKLSSQSKRDSETDRLNQHKEWSKPLHEQHMKALNEVSKNPPKTI